MGTASALGGLVDTQRLADLDRFFLCQHACPPQVSLSLVRHAGRKVAGTSATVLHFAFGGDAEPLLDSFVRFLLGHGSGHR